MATKNPVSKTDAGLVSHCSVLAELVQKLPRALAHWTCVCAFGRFRAPASWKQIGAHMALKYTAGKRCLRLARQTPRQDPHPAPWLVLSDMRAPCVCERRPALTHARRPERFAAARMLLTEADPASRWHQAQRNGRLQPGHQAIRQLPDADPETPPVAPWGVRR